MANYNVVETTKVSGRCFDFVYDADIENGSLIAKGDYVTVDGSTVKINDVATSAPTASTTGFIGQVVEIEEYGFAYCTGTAGNVGKTGKRVVIEVIKNETV